LRNAKRKQTQGRLAVVEIIINLQRAKLSPNGGRRAVKVNQPKVSAVSELPVGGFSVDA